MKLHCLVWAYLKVWFDEPTSLCPVNRHVFPKGAKRKASMRGRTCICLTEPTVTTPVITAGQFWELHSSISSFRRGKLSSHQEEIVTILSSSWARYASILCAAQRHAESILVASVARNTSFVNARRRLGLARTASAWRSLRHREFYILEQ